MGSADSKLKFVFFPYAGVSLFPGHSNASVQATGVEHEWAFQGALTLIHHQLRCSKMSLLDKRSIKRIELVGDFQIRVSWSSLRATAS